MEFLECLRTNRKICMLLDNVDQNLAM